MISILESYSTRVTCLLLFFILLTSCAGTKPDSIGQFSECPEKPNCIFSKSSTALHMIAPLIYQNSFLEAKEKLLKVIKSMPRAEIVTDKENFLHVEFTSKIFRFVDDVEFYFNAPGIIHVRSASRIGHSDMGVNRHRIEEIRHLFTKGFLKK
ncbi:MAG: DUF1499 domain-containing protein [Nitrospina sp.]|nr:DUF1499 domain-containing protein [Nitrospina sp.]